jgi:hypothetical protein
MLFDRIVPMSLRDVVCAIAFCLWSAHSIACSPIFDHAWTTPREVLADSDLVLHVRLTGLADNGGDLYPTLKVTVLGVLKGTYSNEPIITTSSGACGALESLNVGSEYVLYFPRRDGDLRVNMRGFQVATSGLLRQLTLPWDARIDRTKEQRAEINQREWKRAREQGKGIASFSPDIQTRRHTEMHGERRLERE